MSYTGPDFDPPPQRRPRRGPLTVGLAALVCGGLLGWGVYAATGGTDDKGAQAEGSPSAAPRTPSPAASSPEGGGASPSPGDEGSPASRTPSASAPAAGGPLKGC
ncbi:N-acetylmuramoyl-L-alanine amidase, partial [Streptomyces pseudogriseolus]